MPEKKQSLHKYGPIDAEIVRELARLLAETDLSEIELQNGDLRVRVARNVAPPWPRMRRARRIP
jgi:hypothetical protein